MNQPKPCPLCGTVVVARYIGSTHWAIIKCRKCGLEMSAYNIDKLIELWNRRVNDG
jgi:Lar family restriction alleviation protein